jgi:sugar (pentulose or hexulose) kinase
LSDLYLGIDVGTTGTKAAIYDRHGEQLGAGYVSYEVTQPEPGRYVQDPADWRRAATTATRAAASEVDPHRVAAVAISAQGATFAPLDEHREPVAPARSWLDRRAEPDAEHLRRTFGSRGFFQRTGWPIEPSKTCAQILAFAREEPALFERTAYFLETASYLNLWLAGRPVIDTNIAGITQLMNIAAEDWDEQILEILGADRGQLPELARPGEPIGHLTERACEDLDLEPGTVVVAGAHDQYCAALGARVTNNGDTLLSTGTAWVVLAISKNAHQAHQSGFSFGRHLIPGLWGHFGEVPNGGVCLEWIRRLWSEDGLGSGASLARLEELVSTTGPGSGGAMFLPYFDGTGPGELGASSRGSFLGLDLTQDRRHLTRAVMEGVAVAATFLISAHRKIAPSMTPVTVAGGATHSQTWTQIIADVLGEDINVSNTAHAACLGAATLAATGSGAFENPGEAAQQMGTSTTHITPFEPASRTYRRLAERYRLATDGSARMYEDMHRAGLLESHRSGAQ